MMDVNTSYLVKEKNGKPALNNDRHWWRIYVIGQKGAHFYGWVMGLGRECLFANIDGEHSNLASNIADHYEERDEFGGSPQALFLRRLFHG